MDRLLVIMKLKRTHYLLFMVLFFIYSKYGMADDGTNHKNDTILVQRGTMGGGKGDDTYIISDYLVDKSSRITISDVEGRNTILFPDGIKIVQSKIANDTAVFVLSNGAEITLLGASAFHYEVGSDPFTQKKGDNYDYPSFAKSALNLDGNIPSTGYLSGNDVTLNSDPVVPDPVVPDFNLILPFDRKSIIDDFIISPLADGVDKNLENQSFILGYSNDKKASLWSMYKLYSDLVSISRERSDDFREDERISYENRAKLSDYSGSGYDRGHLVPNASIDHTESSQSESFLLSNISPMKPDFNRNEWSQVESWIRECAESKSEKNPLLVITGSIYRSYLSDVIGDGVPVPYAFYKIVVHIDSDSYLRAFAIRAPQSYFDYYFAGLYIETIDDIESSTGIDFFSTLPDSLEDKLESMASPACSFPKWGPLDPALYFSESMLVDDLPLDPVPEVPEVPEVPQNQCYSWKKTCSAMRSCQEAYFYLNSCGVSRLDGDKDGVPCESICR